MQRSGEKGKRSRAAAAACAGVPWDEQHRCVSRSPELQAFLRCSGGGTGRVVVLSDAQGPWMAIAPRRFRHSAAGKKAQLCHHDSEQRFKRPHQGRDTDSHMLLHRASRCYRARIFCAS